jgi:hypothetical protein
VFFDPEQADIQCRCKDTDPVEWNTGAPLVCHIVFDPAILDHGTGTWLIELVHVFVLARWLIDCFKVIPPGKRGQKRLSRTMSMEQ